MAKNRKRGKADKRAKAEFAPKTGKTPKLPPGFTGQVYDAHPGWWLQAIDHDGAFGWDRCSRSDLSLVEKRLASLEQQTRRQLEQGDRSNHSVPRSRISSDAKRRLRDIDMDDVDDLYQLHVTGPKRVWGIRFGPYLKLLWWDPDHQVYPVRKRHT